MMIVVDERAPLFHYADAVEPIMPISVPFFQLYGRPYPLGWRYAGRMEREQVLVIGDFLIMRPATYEAMKARTRP